MGYVSYPGSTTGSTLIQPFFLNYPWVFGASGDSVHPAIQNCKERPHEGYNQQTTECTTVSDKPFYSAGTRKAKTQTKDLEYLPLLVASVVSGSLLPAYTRASRDASGQTASRFCAGQRTILIDTHTQITWHAHRSPSLSGAEKQSLDLHLRPFDTCPSYLRI